jgi:hypothetical protein
VDLVQRKEVQVVEWQDLSLEVLRITACQDQVIEILSSGREEREFFLIVLGAMMVFST